MNRDVMLAPFAEEELHTYEKTWKDKQGQQRSISLTYIEDETVMDRLDAGFGFGNWQIQAEAISENVVKVRLGVREHGEWIWYEDFGYPNREGGESLKEAVSDGIRRCGRFVGIARDLYRKAPDERRTDRPAPARLPARTDPATVDPASAPSKEPYTETEELIGRVRRRGIVRKGSAEGYKLDARQGPDGHVIGFRLEVGPEKHIPQCAIEGPLGEAVYQATGEKPTVLLGIPATVAGILYYVKSNRIDPKTGRDASWYRLHVDRIETTINGLDVILPADPADAPVPEPPAEAETVPLFDDEEQAVIDAALEAAG